MLKLTKEDFKNASYTRKGGAMRYGLLYKEIAGALTEVGSGCIIPTEDIAELYNTTPKKLKGAIWSAICGKCKVAVFREINENINAEVYSCDKGIAIKRIV